MCLAHVAARSDVVLLVPWVIAGALAFGIRWGFLHREIGKANTRWRVALGISIELPLLVLAWREFSPISAIVLGETALWWSVTTFGDGAEGPAVRQLGRGLGLGLVFPTLLLILTVLLAPLLVVLSSLA